jgi:hypothetical protein
MAAKNVEDRDVELAQILYDVEASVQEMKRESKQKNA